MSAIDALRMAHDAGVRIGLDGDMLDLRAHRKPAPEVLDAIRDNKPEILAMLRKQAGIWSPEDYRAHFDERAAIIEHDAGEPRPVAEARAWEWTLVEWLDRHPVRSDPGHCAGCGKAEDAQHVVIPYGTGPHAWLHPECWPDWHADRREKARAALVSYGIEAPE